MAQFLSDEWINDMKAAAEAVHGSQPEAVATPISLKEVVTNTPFGDVAYVLHLDSGAVTLERADDASHSADVTISQDYETAKDLHKGTLSTRDAFFAGRVRVAGKLNLLLDHTETLTGTAPAFDAVRAATTYE